MRVRVKWRAERTGSIEYDLGSLAVLSSTGAILSGAVRERLTELLPNVMILDNFGSSESGYTASASRAPHRSRA